MPISISSSGRSKLGLPACGTVHAVSATPIERTFAMTFSATRHDGVEVVPALGGRARDLLDGDRAGHAAAARRVQRVLDGDVVVDDDGARP